MKISLYSKFVFYTIGAFVISFFLAFLLVNTFYHQYLKEKNDAKNITIAHDIAAYIEMHPDTDVSDYLSSIADTGYKIYLTDGKGQADFFGKEFREENLSKKSIDQVLEGNMYHGMRDLPKETFVTGFVSDEDADTGYKSYITDGKGQAEFIRKEFREENLSKKSIDLVLEGNMYHGMRDLPKETFVTGFFSDELANTAGVPLLIDDENYALFIRP